MIANAYPVGRYTVLEEGEISRETLQFEVAHYLVCDAQGQQFEETFPTLAAARSFIEQQAAPQQP